MPEVAHLADTNAELRNMLMRRDVEDADVPARPHLMYFSAVYCADQGDPARERGV